MTEPKTPKQIADEHAAIISLGEPVVTASPEALSEFLRCAIEADRAQFSADVPARAEADRAALRNVIGPLPRGLSLDAILDAIVASAVWRLRGLPEEPEHLIARWSEDFDSFGWEEPSHELVFDDDAQA